MQNFTTAFYSVLSQSRDGRDLVDLVEIYDPDETDFVPSNAVYRFSTEHISWGEQTYTQELLDRDSITRYYGGQFNEVSYVFSNIRRAIGSMIYTLEMDGYYLLHRIVSRQNNDGASFTVPFVGRIQPSQSANKLSGRLRARQYLGNIEAELPPRTISHRCPLNFKETGGDCLGNEALGSKSAAYQAATTCDKSYDQCKSYANEEFFQGFRFRTASGTFKFKAQRGGAGGALLSLIGLGKKKITKSWTTQDDGAIGLELPLVLGRAQLQGIPLSHADTGTAIAFVVLWCEGKVNAIKNVRVVTPGFDPPQTVANYVGDYGGTGTQTPGGAGTYFNGTPIDHNSKTAFTTGVSFGDNPDTGDPAPEVAAMILGIEMTTPDFDGNYIDEGFSDNPVDVARFCITENKILNHPPELWDDWAAYQTWLECNEPLTDASKGEQVLFNSYATGIAGVDWKLYRTSSVFDTHWLRFLLGLTTDHPSTREIDYQFYTATAPPTSVAAVTYLRKRFTCNIPIVKSEKAIDFLLKNVMPTARLYLITGADGKLQIRREKASTSTLLRSAMTAAATLVPVEDIFAWKSYFSPLVLLGVGLSTSEVRQVMNLLHDEAGNDITLTASGAGATTLTASGALFSGATQELPAKATLTIGGTAANGNTLTATIDGVTCAYTLNTNDTLATAMGMLCATINANATLKRYVKAIWSGYPDVVAVRWEHATYFQVAGNTVTAQINKSATVSGNPNGELTNWVQSVDTITEDGQSFAFQVQNQGTPDTASLDALCIVGLTDDDNPTPTTVVNGAQTYATFAEPDYQFYFILGTGNVPKVYVRTPSGGLLTGELSYTTNSVFRITRTNSTTIKFFIDGVLVHTLTTSVPTTLRLCAVAGTRVNPAYMQPRILNARFIDSSSGNDNIIKLVSKLGFLEIETPTENAHALAEEAIYVAMLFSDRAQDVNARSNMVAGSAEFMTGKYGTYNQVKLTYTDPLNDFQTVTLIENDYDHIARTRTRKPLEIVGQGVDSYHQAQRLTSQMLAKIRIREALEWTAGPMALPLEEGDVVCVSTDIAGDNIGAERTRIFNYPIRLEEVSIEKSPFKVKLSGRRYETALYSDDVNVTTVPLVSGSEF